MKILIIEDEPSLMEVIDSFLVKEGYVVECASDFRSALDRIIDYQYDCILLDIMLPDGNGLDLLSELKSMGKQDSVIIISARDSIDDKVKGLELGADDYLAKPFHLAELNARIKSLIRRNHHQGSMTITLGNIKIDPADNTVKVDGETIDLNRKEYNILNYFAGHSGNLISKETLAEAVWGDHIDQADNYDFIYAQVKNLRKKLNDAGANVEIKAVYGFGYKMIIGGE